MLNIVNKSSLERGSLASCIATMPGGALLLIEDAVYAVTRGHASAAAVAEAAKRFKVYALQPDLEARGLADRLLEAVTAVDYEGFVDLVAQHQNCQSWL